MERPLSEVPSHLVGVHKWLANSYGYIIINFNQEYLVSCLLFTKFEINESCEVKKKNWPLLHRFNIYEFAF